MNNTQQTFTVEVHFDDESEMWWCECDALRLVTEAPSYEALVERATQLALDIAAVNGLNIIGAQLHFEKPLHLECTKKVWS